MSPVQAAELVLLGLDIAKKGEKSVDEVKAWLSGDGGKPADLPEIPDFVENRLELAAAEARARKAGNI